jgi:hypothetical protein
MITYPLFLKNCTSRSCCFAFSNVEKVPEVAALPC